MNDLADAVRPTPVTRRAPRLTISFAVACLLFLAACGSTAPAADIDLHLHDVAVAASLDEGRWRLEIDFQITNRGSQKSPEFTAEVTVLDDAGVTVYTYRPDILAMTAGRTMPVYLGLRLPATFAPGDYTVRLVLDPDHQVPQSDRTNDSVELPLTVGVAARNR